MPAAQFEHRRNLGSAFTSRARSPQIWHDCPWEQIVSGEVDGNWFFEDFQRQPITVPTTEAAYGPDFRGFTSTGGTINAATKTLEGTITLGSDGDDEGASIQTLGAPFKLIRTGGPLWFEARIKFSSIAGLLFDAFVGLAEIMTLTATVPITATGGTLADKNFVGFHRSGVTGAAAGAALKEVYKADGVTQVTLETVSSALVADTYIHVGFAYRPSAFPGTTIRGDNFLRFYLDNLERTAAAYNIVAAAGTDFPNDVLLAPTLAVLNTAGSITDFMSVDWIRCAQLGTTA